MPTIASSAVPPPKSWDEFEDIALSAAKLRWDTSDFFRHGRQGQKQDGVDIWGQDEDRRIGIQCKNTIGGVSFEVVEKEVANAEEFTPPLNKLYISTTAPRDAVLQKVVRELSHKRRSVGKFTVDVLFWDDICGDLSHDDDTFFKHYPQFRGGIDEVRAHDRKLFDDLMALLPSNGVIRFIDQNNMAGFSFMESKLDPLREFYYGWNYPEREFISETLETIRKSLWDQVSEYLDLIAHETFAVNGRPEWHTVPPEWEERQPERFWRVVKQLHSHAGTIVDLHRQLVRAGRAILVGTAYAGSDAKPDA